MHRLFLFFLIVFLPTQLGFHMWPEWALVLGRRIDYLSPTVYLSDIFVIGVIIFGLRNIPRLPMVLFLCVAAVNILWSVNMMVASYHWVKALEFFLLGLYIVRAKPAVSELHIPLTIGVIYSSAVAIIQFGLQRAIGGPLWLLGERLFWLDTPGIARGIYQGAEWLRPYATFPHPNVLGGYLAVVMLWIAISVREKRIIHRVALVLGSVALILTASRSALLAGCVGTTWIVFRKNPLFMIGIIALCVALMFGTFGLQDESVVARHQLNIASLRIWSQYPIAGVGLGNFLVALPSFLPSREVYFLQPVHNIYLLIASQLGLIGMGAIGLFFWKTRSSIHWTVPLLAVLAIGLVDHYFITLQQGQLLLTLMLALAYQAPDSPKNPHVY